MCVYKHAEAPANQQPERSITIKKLKAIFLCTIMILTMMSMTIPANAIELPDGGQSQNTQVAYVTGRTSGQAGKHVSVRCLLSGGNSNSIDYVTATTIVTNSYDEDGNNVLEGIDAFTTVVGWHSSTGSESKSGGGHDISKYGFSISIEREEADLVRGTAGHSVTTDNYGTWICGTTTYFY